jgi:hypothetical protein
MYIGILLGAHPILHISRIRVKVYDGVIDYAVTADVMWRRIG